MRTSVMISCLLLCFCAVNAANIFPQRCREQLMTTFIACSEPKTMYTYDKGKCKKVSCCGCFGQNLFTTKDECEETCKKR
ncbi:hypothetical protein Y032_0864g2756 [Ancylostoma ceylanicum]|uniref:BPTI/Kunitz inhibitor domain-containing protein n=1 Tax=Ancylostoma ceylanicum TaxID=53326 RepID=A0A016WAS8_9BILA|nr:hypothetical protein Y032_0864g2756 [Ancylostoma ceylanicum]